MEHNAQSNGETSTPVSVWTNERSRTFYGHVNELVKELGGKSPRMPYNYRTDGIRRGCSDGKAYILKYEEELHLADHFAFLAHVKEGVEFVSAATIEESTEPPSFTIRLASNHTPSSMVVRGLQKIIGMVMEHALEGRHAEDFRTRLLNEIVTFSQERLYARLRSRHWNVPPWFRSQPVPPPLYQKLKNGLPGLHASSRRSDEILSLGNSLATLIETLKAVETGSSSEQIHLLQEVIRHSSAVSRHAGSQSLEDNLRKRGVPNHLVQTREVLEIDKLSKYLEVCNDLIRLGRQPRTRAVCQNLKLEACEAYLSRRPPGSAETCFVHGEVQLILFYEHKPLEKPPRAIGSSKSCSFLCDSFIRNHGGYGVSHSHMNFYQKWTIPEATWMSQQQRRQFGGIVNAMDAEVALLLNKKEYFLNRFMESKAHILQIERESSIVSSDVSPLVSESLHPATSNSNVQKAIPSITPVQEPSSSILAFRSLYTADDLPILENVVASTLSLRLVLGKVTYIFDCKEIDYGQLHISRSEAREGLEVDVRGVSLDDSLCLRPELGSQTLAFTVHDAGRNELRVAFTWTKTLGVESHGSTICV